VVGLGALAEHGVLHLDEIADLGLLLQHRAGAQPGEGADLDALREGCAFDMAEGVDRDIVGHGHAGAEQHVGFDQHIAANPGVPREPHGFGDRDQGAPSSIACARRRCLPAAFRFGEFGAAVDAGDFVSIVVTTAQVRPSALAMLTTSGR
jgi:hypothetical protein